MNQNELEELAKYFLLRYFGGIPIIPINFCPKRCFNKTELGRMIISESDSYNEAEDDLINEPEYKGENIPIIGDVTYYYNREPSWSDPLNHPDLSILINNECKKDNLLLIGVVLHELCHYYCWYLGYGYHDGDSDFERILKEMNLPSNLEHKYNKEKQQWEDDSDYTKLEKYYQEYLNHI